MHVMLLFIVWALIGYLIGSINPAYILGKILRGIDIRKYGSGNAGASNAAKVLGKPAGVVTAIFDMCKGIIAGSVAWWLSLKLSIHSFLPFIIAGVFAIIGHDFPFYLNFKGGKGAATAYGLFFFCLGLLVYYGLSFKVLISLLAIFFFVLIFRIIFHSFSFSALVVYPGIIVAMLISYTQIMQINFDFAKETFYFMIFLMLYIVTVTLITLHQHGLMKELKLQGNKLKKVKPARKILRIFGILLPLFYFWFGKITLTCILVAVLVFFLITDRLKQHKKLPLYLSALYKHKEGKISNISLFLIDCLIVVLLFPKPIALLALTFLIFGDTMAEVIGLTLGRKKLIGNKSLEGSTACFVSCFISGLAWKIVVNISIGLIVIGSIAATIIELIPLHIKIGKRRMKLDDNLTVGIGSALVMWLFSLFGL